MRHPLPLVVPPAALPTSPLRSPPPAVLRVALVTSPPRLRLPAVRPISRKKSLLLVALPAALAISNPFYPHETRSRREASCREHMKCYSVYPIFI